MKNEQTNVLLAENYEQLLLEIKAGKHNCTYCAEKATGINASGQPVCNIPSNHPEEDVAVVEA